MMEEKPFFGVETTCRHAERERLLRHTVFIKT